MCKRDENNLVNDNLRLNADEISYQKLSNAWCFPEFLQLGRTIVKPRSNVALSYIAFEVFMCSYNATLISCMKALLVNTGAKVFSTILKWAM